MVFFAPFLSVAALYASVASAAPMPCGDSCSPPSSSSDSSSMTSSSMGGYGYNVGGGYNMGYGSSSSSSSSSMGGYGGYGNYGGYGMTTSSSSSTMMDSSTSTTMMDSTSTSSSMMMESTSTSMMDSTSTTMMESTSTSTTMMMESTSTSSSMMESSSTSSSSYSMPTYGSGSMNNGGYNNCVNQCMASYGMPPSMSTTSAPMPQATPAQSGGGSTHTIIVAPMQGVLRYVPFMVNASQGDTVLFKWMADNHTVTKSSALEMCNKSSQAPVFVSGTQNNGFTFTQVVNDTNPIYFYCGTPGHCQKGMFGVINPPSSPLGASAASAMMPGMAQNSPSLAKIAAFANNRTAGNERAANWANSFDMSAIPKEMQEAAAENIYNTRVFLAANTDVFTEDGKVNLNTASPLLFQQKDITDMAGAAPAAAVPSAAAAGSGPPAAATTVAAKKSGAGSLAASGAAAIGIAVLTSFLAL